MKMRLIDADALAEEMGASCIPIMVNGISYAALDALENEEG